MSIKLTPRLMTAVPYVRGGRLVADIGTDHAYLPIYLCEQRKLTPVTVKNGETLCAIAADIKENQPHLRIRNMTCDELLTDFYDLLTQKKSLTDFRCSVRDVDVLLVDDIHNLANKKQIQEEFFNVFNALYKRNAQIVLTSDRQPCELSGIEQRLTTRFESEMVSELNMPGFEARMAILRMWRDDILSPSPLPDVYLEFVAGNITSSVRRLKSAFFRLATFSSFNGSEQLTIQRAEELLRAQIAQRHAAAGAGNMPSQIQNADSRQRAHICTHRLYPPLCFLNCQDLLSEV